MSTIPGAGDSFALDGAAALPPVSPYAPDSVRSGHVPAPDQVPAPELVEETKSQIRALIQEITQLSQADITWDEFASGFMTRVVSALASFGGVLWRKNDSHGLQAQYQINLAKAGISLNGDGAGRDSEARHRRLLEQVVKSGQAVLVAPQSGVPGDSGAGNPTDHLLVIGVFQVEGTVEGVVEIFQRADSGPATQRGYLRFLIQMCELASDYVRNCRLRDYSEQRTFWNRFERLVRTVHESLSIRSTAFAIANEGRNLVGADRVTVLSARGKRLRIEAISGLDSWDRRSAELVLLEKLAQAVIIGNQPLWYGQDVEELAPQVERPLQEYLDHSHAKALIVLPLERPTTNDETVGGHDQYSSSFAALVVEQRNDGMISATTRQRLEIVTPHCSEALQNAIEHETIWLLDVWKWMGRGKRAIWNGAASKWIAIALILAGLAVAGALIQTPFSVAARGKLQPKDQHEVFAQTDGTVVELLVGHGSKVMANQLLARMRNELLDAEVLTLLERQTTTREQIEAKQLTLVNSRSLTAVDESLISGELAQLRESAKSIEQQLVLLKQKQEKLEIRSPQAGEIMTWDVESSLLQRPVQRGQVLMSVANPDSEWNLELYVPERRAGHLITRDLQREPLKVTFTLKSYAAAEFQGEVVEIQRTVEVRGDEGNVVVVRVAIDKQSLPVALSESTVQAKLHCGRRTLAYVWFGDVYDQAHAMLFRWWP